MPRLLTIRVPLGAAYWAFSIGIGLVVLAVGAIEGSGVVLACGAILAIVPIAIVGVLRRHSGRQ
jgi:hypothetical protein